MCDETTSFTQRAKAWIKESEPTRDQIQDAYSKMKAKVAKEPNLENEDTEQCLEFLITAYAKAGGSLDDLLCAEEETSNVASAAIEASLDYGPLYQVSDSPVDQLAPSEKRAAFLRLKDQLKRQSLSA